MHSGNTSSAAHEISDTKKRISRVSKRKTASKHAEASLCCAEDLKNQKVTVSVRNPSHKDSSLRLKKIRGQIYGLENMISEQRYCVEILTQLRAVSAALRAVEVRVFEEHLRNCVKSTLASQDENQCEEKINEILLLFQRK